ncbi:hypothetical protein TWF696_000092 [Orbilia brochopaga]|uniref:Uncharacterized protein n=1 Tax=Orbilia brochopaga TaxID=3140254 RepID=A0AAV9VAA1_9PEZI
MHFAHVDRRGKISCSSAAIYPVVANHWLGVLPNHGIIETMMLGIIDSAAYEIRRQTAAAADTACYLVLTAARGKGAATDT